MYLQVKTHRLPRQLTQLHVWEQLAMDQFAMHQFDPCQFAPSQVFPRQVFLQIDFNCVCCSQSRWLSLGNQFVKDIWHLQTRKLTDIHGCQDLFVDPIMITRLTKFRNLRIFPNIGVQELDTFLKKRKYTQQKLFQHLKLCLNETN